MTPQTKDILDRTLRFSVETIAFTKTLPSGEIGYTITRQVIRCAASIGANFREAQFSRSRAEFVSKIQIALQEASETLYWLQTIQDCKLGDRTSLGRLIEEADQLVSILVAITKSTKRKSGTSP